MSYYATFKPTQEAIDTLREKDPFSYKKEQIFHTKYIELI